MWHGACASDARSDDQNGVLQVRGTPWRTTPGGNSNEECDSTFDLRGRHPASVTLIEVREAYLHCAKALMRSRLWDPEAQIDRSTLPSMGQMLKDQIGLSEPAETQAEMVEKYEADL